MTTDSSSETEAEENSEQESLSWDEARSALEKETNKRETRQYQTEQGPVEFTIRALDQDERDDVEQTAATEQQKADKRTRTGQAGEIEMWPVKRKQLEYGIVSGPDGFKPHREDHLKQLPPFVVDDLFQRIDELGELDVEAEEGFPKMG